MYLFIPLARTLCNSVTRGHTRIACTIKMKCSYKCWFPPTSPHGVTTKKSNKRIQNTIHPCSTQCNTKYRNTTPAFLHTSSTNPGRHGSNSGTNHSFYICIVHTVVLFQSSLSVCHLTQHVNLLSKTHYTGVNVRTITDQ
jgi:hypothetical protein